MRNHPAATTRITKPTTALGAIQARNRHCFCTPLIYRRWEGGLNAEGATSNLRTASTLAPKMPRYPHIRLREFFPHRDRTPTGFPHRQVGCGAISMVNKESPNSSVLGLSLCKTCAPTRGARKSLVKSDRPNSFELSLPGKQSVCAVGVSPTRSKIT